MPEQKDLNWQVAACSTDTVWGLVCRIDGNEEQNKANIEKIYELKQRDRDKPLILFGSSIEDLRTYVENWSPLMEDLAQKYWAGALTIIAPRSNKLASYINPGLDSIGLRIPNSASVRYLLEQTKNKVLLSTSANLSGEPELRSYDEAQKLFSDKVELILKPKEEEKCSDTASTIVKVEADQLKILRQGNIVI